MPTKSVAVSWGTSQPCYRGSRPRRGSVRQRPRKISQIYRKLERRRMFDDLPTRQPLENERAIGMASGGGR